MKTKDRRKYSSLNTDDNFQADSKETLQFRIDLTLWPQIIFYFTMITLMGIVVLKLFQIVALLEGYHLVAKDVESSRLDSTTVSPIISPEVFATSILQSSTSKPALFVPPTTTSSLVHFTTSTSVKRKLWLVAFGDGDARYQARLDEFKYDSTRCGWFDHITICNDACISQDFKDSHPRIWKNKRGHGLWVWKPLIIMDVMKKMGPDDVALYLDVGCVVNCQTEKAVIRFWEYIDLVANYTEGVPILAMGIPRLEKHYSKMGLKLHLNLSDAHWNSAMFESGIIFMRKSQQVADLMQQWLDVMTFDGGRFTQDKMEPDDPPNDPGFVQNRRDMSVFSMLMKIHNGLRIKDETYPFHPRRPIWAARKRVAGNRTKYHLPEIPTETSIAQTNSLPTEIVVNSDSAG